MPAEGAVYAQDAPVVTRLWRSNVLSSKFIMVSVAVGIACPASVLYLTGGTDSLGVRMLVVDDLKVFTGTVKLSSTDRLAVKSP